MTKAGSNIAKIEKMHDQSQRSPVKPQRLKSTKAVKALTKKSNSFIRIYITMYKIHISYMFIELTLHNL